MAKILISLRAIDEEFDAIVIRAMSAAGWMKLRGWKKEVRAMAENKHLLTLEGGAYSYEVGFDREFKTLFIMGVAETSTPNFIAVRVLSLGFRWPPWRYVNCFTPHPDYEGGEKSD